MPCSLFPPKSFLHHGSSKAVPLCTHPYLSPLSLSVGHGKCGQPSGRTRFFTPFQKQSSLPSSTQRILKQTPPCNPKFAEASVSSLEFWKKKKKKFDQCQESAWKLRMLENEFTVHISQLLFIPLSRSVLSSSAPLPSQSAP